MTNRTGSRRRGARRSAPGAATFQHPAIEMRDIDRLSPNARNARRHSRKQIRQIAASIERFGFTVPIVVDEHGTILAGHGRVEAAKHLGLPSVPVIALSHLSEPEKRAYVLADNKLALNAGWDREILAIELGALIELDFEVELTGFETPEIDLLFAGEQAKKRDPDPGEDKVREIDRSAAPVSRAGDVWELGSHRLICGSALDEAAYATVMSGERARMVVTDPPYNLAVSFIRGMGRSRHREFAMASGEMSEAQFVEFLARAHALTLAHSEAGALHFVFMGWQHLREALNAGQGVYGDLVQLVVWDKLSAGMGGLYRNQHELVLVWKVPGASSLNNVELGKHGRNRSNVWSHRGLAGFGKERDEDLAAHPTVKPAALIADALRDASKPRDVVLDPFAGSGTILLAAEATGRRARAIEIDAHFCDVALARWEHKTGKRARLAAVGLSFEEIGELRSNDETNESTGEGRAA